MATKRPQNKCKDCHYTWYPRGKSQSLKCPNCNGKNTSIIIISWPQIISVTAILLFILLSLTTKTDSAKTITKNEKIDKIEKIRFTEENSIAHDCLSELINKPRKDGLYISTDDADSAFIEKVSSFWVRPSSAHNGMQAELLVKILSNGKIFDATVINTSGDMAFDQSTINALDAAAVICEISQVDPQKYTQQYKERRVIFSPEDLEGTR